MCKTHAGDLRTAGLLAVDFGAPLGAREVFAKVLIARPLVGAEQANFVRNRLTDEGFQSFGLDVRNDAGHNISLAADGADDRSFAGTNAAGSITIPAFVLMPVLGQAADESFIDFDNATKLLDILHKSNSDLVAHEPRGFQRTETHISPNLPSAHSFLTNEHEVDDAIPIAQRLIGVLENGAGDDREPITVWSALFALPMPFTSFKIIDLWIAAARTINAIWPAPGVQVSLASILIGEHGLELGGGQLHDLRRLFGSGHGFLPAMEGYWHV